MPTPRVQSDGEGVKQRNSQTSGHLTHKEERQPYARPVVQAGLFKVPKAPVGQWTIQRQESPKLASVTEPKVKLAPSTGK